MYIGVRIYNLKLDFVTWLRHIQTVATLSMWK